ncbi:MAG: tetratricopeptide repeat protein [Calditrichaeota bacterium]|nr:tetratricopeptide repeat protein [Calditrichota bacterium]
MNDFNLKDLSDHEKYKYCRNDMNEGKFVQALHHAETISNPGFRAAILIDAGFASGKSERIRDGIRLFKQLLESDYEGEIDKSSLFYNIANGYDCLNRLKCKKTKKFSLPNDQDVQNAKKYYRKSIQHLVDGSGEFASQVYVNYGNCLTRLGRFSEAMENYQKATELDPKNGMAFGNLGIEYERSAMFTQYYRHEYYALARKFLGKALSNTCHLKWGSPQAATSFQNHYDFLTDLIKKHKKPILEPEIIKPSGKNQEVKDYITFCIENGLFLNGWVGDPTLSPGIIDDISFGPILAPIDDNYFVPELLRILNEIKEAFSTARYLFFLSQQKRNSLDEISHVTFYFDNLDYDINGIYTGLCKTAYGRAFDILDKIGVLLHVYYGIGNRKDSFWYLLVRKESRGEEHIIGSSIRTEILATNNVGLFALADICMDYFEKENTNLSDIDTRRNKVTHDSLPIRQFGKKDNQNTSMVLDDFTKETLHLLLLAKHAILYSVTSINFSEKEKNYEGPLGNLYYFATPGQPFL